MEFPNLGKNCSWLPCKELDFLPLECAHCKSVFCKNHIHVDCHECVVTRQEKSNKTPIQTFSCTYENCNSFSAVEMKCPRCEKHFCLCHRYHGCFEQSEEEIASKKVIWNASKQQFAQSLSEVHKIVNEGIKKSMKNPKKQEAARKLNLMRLKSKSQGPKTIPVNDRVYFCVLYKKDASNHICKPIFTCKDWSVGRVIDSISEICSVPNKNNMPYEKKLRLFKRSDGTQISSDTSAKINDLINENEVIDGETLILEYIMPSEDLLNFRLTNFQEYKEL